MVQRALGRHSDPRDRYLPELRITYIANSKSEKNRYYKYRRLVRWFVRLVTLQFRPSGRVTLG